MDGDERADGSVRPDPVQPDPVQPDEVPRLVAWLRSERPRTTVDELAALLRDVPPDRARHVEQALDDLARGCRPPAPADLAALTELDDRLGRLG